MNATLKEWTDDEVRQYIDELYPEVKIGNLSFSASRIIEELDPIAFNCISSEMEDRWICNECGVEYDSEEEAEECCEEEET